VATVGCQVSPATAYPQLITRPVLWVAVVAEAYTWSSGCLGKPGHTCSRIPIATVAGTEDLIVNGLDSRAGCQHTRCIPCTVRDILQQMGCLTDGICFIHYEAMQTAMGPPPKSVPGRAGICSNAKGTAACTSVIYHSSGRDTTMLHALFEPRYSRPRA